MLEITKQPSGDPRENRWQDRPEHWDLWFFSNIKSDSFNIQRLQGWCYRSVEIIVKILRVLILVWPNFIHTYVDRCKHVFYMCLCLLLCAGGCGLCGYKLLPCNHMWATTESFKLSDCHQDVQNNQKRSWNLQSRIWIYPDFLTHLHCRLP